MPSARLQKRAGGSLSGGGGGGGGNDSPLTSARGGTGGIRAFLQSIRSHTGLSDSGSPRGSRSGAVDGSRPSTPRGSHSQHMLASNIDSLHADSDGSDSEDVLSGLFPGADGVPAVSAPARTVTVNEAPCIGLPQEVPLAASRSYSGRWSGRATPDAVTSGLRDSNSAKTPLQFINLSVELGGIPRVASAAHFSASGSVRAALVAVDVYATPQMHVIPLAASASSLPSGPVSETSLVADLQELTAPASASPAPVVPPRPPHSGQLPACSTSLGDPSLPPLPTDSSPNRPNTIPNRPGSGLRSFKPSHQLRLLDEAGLCPGAAASAPGTHPPLRQTSGDGVSSGDGVEGDGAEGDVDGAEGDGGCSAPTPGGMDCAGRHCRSACSGTLSAMAVSQAVHRLQLRQQQEKAAGRYQRTSTALHQQFTGHHAHRDAAAAATTHRVLSVASDGVTGGSEYGPCTSYGNGGDAPACASWHAGTPQMPPPQVQSHARRLLGPARASSSTATPHYQHELFDSYRSAASSSPRRNSCSGGGGGRADAPNSGLDEWLGDVPDMSSGRVPCTPAEAERRSSVSYTEGHLSNAERLQAMVSGAVSGDDAASYLQQLLLPDMPSTASVELQYSSAGARVPSVLALAYGSSGGTACGMRGGGGGLFGGLLGCSTSGSSPRALSQGDNAQQRLASADSRSHYGSGHGYLPLLTGEWPSGVGNVSSSRASSVVLVSSTSAPSTAQPHPASGGAQAAGGSGGSGGSGGGCQHQGKTAAQLVEELCELARRSRPDSSTAPIATTANGNGNGIGTDPRASPTDREDAPALPASPARDALQRQQCDELVAALWRLVHAKDSEAVSYLLGVDPGAQSTRPVAPILKEMRSWVYLNMW